MNKLLLSAGLLAFCQLTASAAVSLISWGGNVTDQTFDFNNAWVDTGAVNLDGDGLPDDSCFGTNLGVLIPSTAPLAPTNYTGGNIYGGLVVHTLDNVVTDSLSSGNYAIHNAGGNDHIVVHTQHSGNHHHIYDAFFYWDKSDFMSGGDAFATSLGSGSEFSLSTLNSSLIKGNEHLHFVIREGGNFYISQDSFGPTGTLGTFTQGADLAWTPSAGSLWALYNPAFPNYDHAPGGYTFQTSGFTDITAVGFLIDSDSFSSNAARVEISGFSVNASVVPEPSGTLLQALIGAAGLGFVGRRRRTVA